MNKSKEKNKQIHDIVAIVRLCSLLLSGIGIFQFRLNHLNIEFSDFNYTNAIYFIIAIVFFLTLVYYVWTFATSRKFCGKQLILIKFVENYLFVLLFVAIVILTGAQKSEFKFLFLFLIITTTIEAGMKKGITISCVSSVLVLAIDLVFGPKSGINTYFQNDLVLAGVFILTAWPLGFYVKTESEHIKKLESLANEDGLTEVYNHRFFHDSLREKLLVHESEGASLSLIFLDIDHFKHYNDLYGHQKGDEVLKAIGAILKRSVRKEDIVARYGGEEFAVILPYTVEQDAINIAENIRRNIEETYFDGEENQPKGKLTSSIGVSVFPDKAKSDLELIKSADDALYRAKFFNKNRVEVYYSILDELKEDIEDKHIDLVTSIKTLISVINAKDKYTYGHVERVVAYSRLLADKLGLSEEDKKTLIYGAYMHDIGKMNILEEILNKRMPLTKEEWEILKQHPENGLEIIKPVESLTDISPLILHHHERYDGNGYPGRLKGEEIPYLVRILTVVDSFDAMTSNRPYSKRKTHREAIEELKNCSGTQFDPHIAQVFIDIIMANDNNYKAVY
ncbi:diguanylate cyclase [Clostridium sp. YIM B02505]|uniref:Diguanylate cyclase n=1 Tax=Clostridium yunnanense TaxID=2800325 RepID=A0ABS1EK56_9CLOT|nr:diguanylate cyclase [Clostridium yunnanense]MBK1809751.1 diguanylate cyclase [Clostridium yunnanense]